MDKIKAKQLREELTNHDIGFEISTLNVGVGVAQAIVLTCHTHGSNESLLPFGCEKIGTFFLSNLNISTRKNLEWHLKLWEDGIYQ